MSRQESVVEGVSQVTVKNGDTTFFFDVENLVISYDDGYSGYDFSSDDLLPQTENYAIRARMVPSGDGYYYKVVKPVRRETVLCTAEIATEGFEPAQIESARKRVEAPDTAFYERIWDEAGKVSVKFKWMEEK